MIETDIMRLSSRLQAVCPIDGCSLGDMVDPATRRVDCSSTATDDQRAAAATVLTAFDPTVYSDNELKILAFQKAGDYVARFFTTLQLEGMDALLMADPENVKARAILAWIGLVRGEALTNYTNPNFDQFTPPTFTYEQVMGIA